MPRRLTGNGVPGAGKKFPGEIPGKATLKENRKSGAVPLWSKSGRNGTAIELLPL